MISHPRFNYERMMQFGKLAGRWIAEQLVAEAVEDKVLSAVARNKRNTYIRKAGWYAERIAQ